VVLINEVKVTCCFEHIVVFDNVWTVEWTHEYVDFIYNSYFWFKILFELISSNYFDPNLLFVFDVVDGSSTAEDMSHKFNYT